jgi:hypothetical protein
MGVVMAPKEPLTREHGIIWLLEMVKIATGVLDVHAPQSYRDATGIDVVHSVLETSLKCLGVIGVTEDELETALLKLTTGDTPWTGYRNFRPERN